MTYSKPEVAVLGNANDVIHGVKSINQEPPPHQTLPQKSADSELDD